MATTDEILWNVVQTHFDEAEFLFQQWSAAAQSPRLSLVDVRKTIERRLLAHLDGLVVGGELVAEKLLWPVVAADTEAPASMVAAAALALLMLPDPQTPERLLQAFRATENQSLTRGLASACKVAPRSDIDESLRLALYATDSPAAQTALLDVLAARRVDPGPILGVLLTHAEASVVRAALGAAAAVVDRDRLRQLLEDCLAHAAAAVRAAAVRTGMIWNLSTAWRACTTEARAGSPEAMFLLALIGGADAVAQISPALQRPERRKAALFALGFTGLADAVDACLPFLDDTDAVVARLAGEAVAGITGLPLYESGFARAADGDAGDDELPPLEEDLRIDLMPLPHDDLPLTDGRKVRDWWSKQRPLFATSDRYLRGAPLSTASVSDALEVGPLRRSGALTCEIAIRSGGRVQLAALRLAHRTPALPTEVSLQRRPAWR